VFDREWAQAQSRLESYLDRYPEGRFEQEARYWLARCFNQMSLEARQPQEVIRLKKRAIENIDLLLRKYPDSIWKDDAQMLRLEVAAQLALLGDQESAHYIQEVITKQHMVESDMKMAALEAMAQMEPQTALPLIEGVLNEETSAETRKAAVTLVARFHGVEALPLLRRIEAEDADPRVREEAARWCKRIEMLSIPVGLNYYAYVGVLQKDRSRVPENAVEVFDFPALRTPSKQDVKREVKRSFGEALSDLKFASNATIQAWLELASSSSYGTNVAHNLAGFRVQVPVESIVKSYADVTGTASFFDKITDREYSKEFVVDAKRARLMAARHGDEVAILVLLFASSEEPREQAEEPVYHTEINNVFGSVVHSSRQSWGMDEMSGAVVEYGRARAEIAGDGGTWILIGDIQLRREDKLFVGRDAVLYNPKGEVAAEGVEIVVPAGAPQKYEVKVKKASG
jgi:hypothetical protein